MTNEEAIKFLELEKESTKTLWGSVNHEGGREYFEKSLESLDMAIKALEQQPCIEDYPTCTECEHYDSEKHYCPRFCQVIKDTLTEAQPSEDCISRQKALDCFEQTNTRQGAKYAIETLPSVTPQRQKGKWLRRRPSGCYSEYIMECSECKGLQRSKYNFCPSCGCRMEVEE